MTTALIGLCALSFILIVLLFVNAKVEMRNDTQTFISRFLSRFDPKVTVWVARGHHLLHHSVKETHSFITEDVPRGSVDAMKSIQTRLGEKYRDMMPDVRGKRIFKGERNASTYLENIRKERELDGKGRIED